MMTNAKHSTPENNRNIHLSSGSKALSDLPWVNHPTFRGVAMKHMITGSETEGRFSCHMVRIEPGCSLETHCHDRHMERHDVLDGRGVFTLLDACFDYAPGEMAVIPQGADHSVQAGTTGLTLCATFFPALA